MPDTPDLLRGQRLGLHLLLFAATCGTTFLAGALTSGTQQQPFDWVGGALFSVTIMGILLIHEMGHFLAARHHGVSASLPYFIPMPLPPVGTFGAVIRMREPPRTTGALLDIGMIGPLCGLLVAVAACFIGLTLSEVKPLAKLPPGAFLEGNSLLYFLLKRLAQPQMTAAQDVFLHPVAWAGWLGLLVTSLNLLPAGQLDGGHVLYALAGARTHRRVTRGVHVLVFALGLIGVCCQLVLLHGPSVAWLRKAELLGLALRGSGMTMWLVWAVLLRFVGGPHPELPSQAPLSAPRRLLGWTALAVLALTFTPSVWSPLNP